ncbi:hypothetical protein D3C81_1930850 [compost metagenome]
MVTPFGEFQLSFCRVYFSQKRVCFDHLRIEFFHAGFPDQIDDIVEIEIFQHRIFEGEIVAFEKFKEFALDDFVVQTDLL